MFGMNNAVALALFALAVAPLVCVVDFAFYRRGARQKPSWLWPSAFALPWILLIIGVASGANVLMPVALFLAGVFTLWWMIKRIWGR